MRFAALVCALALLASPYFFAYYEAEHLLDWPQAMYCWFDAWLTLITILLSLLITLALPWIVALVVNSDEHNLP
jgi:hypothetical protein